MRAPASLRSKGDRTDVTNLLRDGLHFEKQERIETRTSIEHNGIIAFYIGLLVEELIQALANHRGERVQRYWIGRGDAAREVCLPAPESEVLAGLPWGRADVLDTAAYWALRCMIEDNPLHGFTSKSGSLIEEIGFCLLGGFGITAELNAAAFDRLIVAGVFDLTATISEQSIRKLLLEPLQVDRRSHRYRFPNQRACRLSTMRSKLRGVDLEGLPIASVSRILKDIPGIGPKTASWIIRNHFGSDDVAILDVHVIRACSRLRLFPDKITLPRDYETLEQKFLTFAQAIEIRPAILDAVMWTDMRNEPRTYRRLAA